ncbi:MAG TPA: DUF5908 family protein [Dissulfurispiraceae bacterium]|nr:DUF5908 family protein [Dissulfurispiraceae bacterium]
MPVQVNELVIRAVIAGESGPVRQAAGEEAPDREALVAECVEQVLAILADRKER